MIIKILLNLALLSSFAAFSQSLSTSLVEKGFQIALKNKCQKFLSENSLFCEIYSKLAVRELNLDHFLYVNGELEKRTSIFFTDRILKIINDKDTYSILSSINSSLENEIPVNFYNEVFSLKRSKFETFEFLAVLFQDFTSARDKNDNLIVLPLEYIKKLNLKNKVAVANISELLKIFEHLEIYLRDKSSNINSLTVSLISFYPEYFDDYFGEYALAYRFYMLSFWTLLLEEKGIKKSWQLPSLFNYFYEVFYSDSYYEIQNVILDPPSILSRHKSDDIYVGYLSSFLAVREGPVFPYTFYSFLIKKDLNRTLELLFNSF